MATNDTPETVEPEARRGKTPASARALLKDFAEELRAKAEAEGIGLVGPDGLRTQLLAAALARPRRLDGDPLPREPHHR